ETGRGRIIMRAKAEIESDESHDKIVVTEIPYGVNKQQLIEYIADLVKEGKLEGISNANDESDRHGMRIVIDVKRDANANVILNKLFKMTALQSSFSVNQIALVKGRPRLLTLKDCIKYFVEHRHDVTIRRTKYDKRKAEERAHLLEALIVACDNIDEVVRIIRASKTPAEAQQKLMERFGFDEVQAKYVVDMRLSQLTGLQQEKLHAEFDELQRLIQYLQQILDDPELCKKVMKDELLEVKEKYGDERRTKIIPAEHEFNAEDFYPNDPVVITVSHLGYVKRTPLSEYREQARGGVGAKAARHRESDFAELIYPATMHQILMFFTKKGRCYWLHCYELPEGGKDFKGRAIQNMMNIEPDDKVQYILRLRSGAYEDEEFINSHYVVFSTKNGTVKKTVLEQFSRPRANGVIAINLLEGDELMDVRLTNGHNELIIASRNGRAVRFNEDKIRTMGRVSTGVRGMLLDNDDDAVIGMVVVNDADQETVMVVSENGYGKRSQVEEYRVTNRGGKGVRTMNVTDKTGKLVAIKNVNDSNDLMIINKSGIAIRLSVAECRVMGRNTQGVKLINLTKKNDVIAAVTKVMGIEQQTDLEEASRAAWAKNNEEFAQPEDAPSEVDETPIVDFSDEEPTAE
ncbi:MAG: DNA gyrase C-terminal beta-propeller domain-containing protein, partial [Prevotellaceae bacterium]|nr:DNA gyrase C-terminal beta-propeller domain-containing protein [Prevotellaceae bacterium]